MRVLARAGPAAHAGVRPAGPDFCFLEKLSEVRTLTTFYFAKNDHRWVTFISLKTITDRPQGEEIFFQAPFRPTYRSDHCCFQIVVKYLRMQSRVRLPWAVLACGMCFVPFYQNRNCWIGGYYVHVFQLFPSNRTGGRAGAHTHVLKI